MFINHEIKNEDNGLTTIYLHMDLNMTMEEFSTELGSKEKSIDTKALAFVKKNFPNLKATTIKVMAGALLVTTIATTPLALNKAHADEPDPSGNAIGHEDEDLPSGDINKTTADAEAEVEAGVLNTGDLVVGNFTAVVLEGRTQHTFANLQSFPIYDATGSGTGWNVVMKATPLVNQDGHELERGALRVKTPKVEKLDDNSSDVASITNNGGTIDSAEGLKILSAPEGGGMGRYTASFDPDALELTLLPREARAGTYTTTISVTINMGP